MGSNLKNILYNLQINPLYSYGIYASCIEPLNTEFMLNLS